MASIKQELSTLGFTNLNGTGTLYGHDNMHFRNVDQEQMVEAIREILERAEVRVDRLMKAVVQELKSADTSMLGSQA